MGGTAVVLVLSGALLFSLLVTGTLPDAWIGRPINQAYRTLVQGQRPVTWATSQSLIDRCDDPEIRSQIKAIYPEYQRAGMVCNPSWLTLEVWTGNRTDFVLVHATGRNESPWSIQAIVDSSGRPIQGDISLVPDSVLARIDPIREHFFEYVYLG